MEEIIEMNSFWWFILSALAIIAALLFGLYRTPKNIINFFKSNPGAAKGIVLALLFVIVGVITLEKVIAEPLKTFDGMYIYAGVEHPNKPSRFCEYGFENHYWTSNLGGGLNLLKSTDNKFEMNLNYTHHSCVVARDAISYDAWGLQMRYQIDFK